MKYDVLYVHPSVRLKLSGMIFSPAGLTGALNNLKAHGISVLGVNHALELALNSDFNIEDCISKLDFTVALIDLHWNVHSYTALFLAQTIKKLHPEAKVILGGLTASYFAPQILAFCPDVDFILSGETEETAVLLVSELLRDAKTSRIHAPGLYTKEMRDTEAHMKPEPVMQLDQYDYVDMSFLLHHKEYTQLRYIVGDNNDFSITNATSISWLLNGRGCLFDCSYCGGGSAAHRLISGRQKPSLISPERTGEQIQQIAGNHVDIVGLTHDPFVFGTAYWQALFSTLQKKQTKIGLYNEVWQLPDDEFIHTIANTFEVENTVLAISPLTGNEMLRSFNGKHFSNDAFLSCLQAAINHKIRLFIYFSINLPGDSERFFRETIALIQRIQECASPDLVRILSYEVIVDPGCPIHRNPEALSVECQQFKFRDYYEAYKLFNNEHILTNAPLFINRGETIASRRSMDAERLHLIKQLISDWMK